MGVYFITEHEKFSGTFDLDQREGPGIYDYENGASFEGEYSNNEKNG